MLQEMAPIDIRAYPCRRLTQLLLIPFAPESIDFVKCTYPILQIFQVIEFSKSSNFRFTELTNSSIYQFSGFTELYRFADCADSHFSLRISASRPKRRCQINQSQLRNGRPILPK
jgi:hypothetical protein